MRENIKALEEMLEVEEGSLNLETQLSEIEEWDSMTKLSVSVYVQRNYKRKLSMGEIKNFVIVKDICDSFHE